MLLLKHLVILVLFSAVFTASAHQFTPTYPQFVSSFVEGVVYTKMELFNKRQDTEYYELGVFTATWEPVSFASEDKLIYVKYLQTKKFNVYIRKQDLGKATYICTESRIKKEDAVNTVISSKICSKIKQ